MLDKKDDKENPTFRDAIKNVTPLTYDKVTLKKSRNKIQQRHSMPDSDEIPTVRSSDKLFYIKRNLPQKVLQKLKKGQYNHEDCLDLHGLTIKEAKSLLDDFIQECFDANYFCIMVIHGKGRQNFDNPILKNQVNIWLRMKPEILAFSQAINKHGGLGAIYVLLEGSR